MQNDKTYSETQNPAYSEILSLITTESEKDELVSQIENLSRAVYKVGTSDIQKIQSELDMRVAEIIKTIPQDQLPEFLNDLKEKLNSLLVAKITLSFNPKVSFVKKLHDFFIQNLTPGGIVLDITVDPEIIGGVILELGGKFTDLTVKKKLNEYI